MPYPYQAYPGQIYSGQAYPNVQVAQPIPAHSYSAAQPQAFVCRPVASKEEVLAFPADFMGTPQFFPDLGHGVVYMKRFNTQTGAADTLEFKVEKPQENDAIAFASVQDLADLRDALDNLRTEVEKLKKPQKVVKKNDASDE